MKIVIDNAIPYIKNRFPEDIETLYISGKDISEEDVRDADALIVRTRTRCDSNLLKDSKIRLVATATIGTDHIDKVWCEENGVKVKSAPGCNAPGVAQYVMASLFKTGFNPDSNILGIIGYGNVGSLVGKWAKSLGINVIVSDAPRQKARYYDIEYFPMEEVLKKSNAVTLHVPFTKEGQYPTYRMIGEKELELLKPETILINSSRGGIVDEKALKTAIKNKKLKAIIDVWENEPIIDSELVKLATIATPHIAGYSSEGKKRATGMVLEAIQDTFGIDVDLSGLECNPEDTDISRKLIEDSYNPLIDHKNLIMDILRFEQLRNEYPLRHEPLFITRN